MSAKEMFEQLGYELAPEGTYAEDKILPYRCYKKNIEIEFFLKEKQFVKAKRAIDCVAIKESELKAIIQQCKELGWLEDEKQEIKQETNIEHYYEYLSEVGLGGFALVNGRCTECSGTRCSKCDFGSDGCNKLRWLASTYIKKYKLTQFEYDLIQTYSDYGDYKLSKFNRLIKLKDKGHFKDADKEATIGDILGNCEVI